MKKRLVLACFGDAVSTAAIAQHADAAEVIVAAFDLTGAVPLADVRDAAVAAGAVRCHVLDVRETFLGEVVLPGLRRGVAPEDAYTSLAPGYVTAKLRELATLEDADYLRVSAASLTLPMPRPSARTVAPTVVEIRLEPGLPAEINGIEMSLSELLDSIETITGEPALTVLSRHLRAPRDACAGDAASEVRDDHSSSVRPT
jgi:argininosuccinate synthase